MKDFIVSPAVQMFIATLIAAIVIVSFVTHQTSALGSVLSSVASMVGMFCYRAGWLHGSEAPPPPPPPAAPAASQNGPSDPPDAPTAVVTPATEATQQ
jgi:hypothetical protein